MRVLSLHCEECKQLDTIEDICLVGLAKVVSPTDLLGRYLAFGSPKLSLEVQDFEDVDRWALFQFFVGLHELSGGRVAFAFMGDGVGAKIEE